MMLGFVCVSLLMLLSSTVTGFNCGFNDSFAEEQELREMDRTAHEMISLYEWDLNCDGQREVPYFWIFPEVNEETKNAIRSIMREFESKACLKFVEVQEPPEQGKKHLGIQVKPIQRVFGLENGNFSEVKGGSSIGGYVDENPEYPGNVKLAMGFPIEKKKSVRRNIFESLMKHELFHVFGITHTQRRNDRDQYIQVNYENIPDNAGWRRQFMKCEECPVPEDVPYECNSIMHYNPYQGSRKGSIANGTKFDYPTMIGRGTVPSCSKIWITPEEEYFPKEPQQPTENDWKSLALKTCPPSHEI